MRVRLIDNAHKELGFSVLEAMVAMAILAMAMLPILSLQLQFTKNLESMERVEARLSIRDSAMHYLKNINITEAREGRFQQDGHLVTWTSVPFVPTRSAKSFGGMPGRFEIMLYTVSVSVTLNQKEVDRFELRNIGWRAVIPNDDF